MGKKSIFDFTFANRRRIAQDSDTAVRDMVISVGEDVFFATKEIEYHCDLRDYKPHENYVEKAISGIEFVLGMDYGLAIDEEDFKEYVEHLRNMKESLLRCRESGWKVKPLHCIDPIVYFKLDRKHCENLRRMCGEPVDVFDINERPKAIVPAEPGKPPKKKVPKDTRKKSAPLCLLLALALSMSGCLNIIQHTSPGHDAPTFSGCGSVCQMCAYMPVMIIPGIVMMPVEFCADLITFPYDWWNNRGRK